MEHVTKTPTLGNTQIYYAHVSILIGMKRTCIVQGISIHAPEALLVVSFRLSLMLYAQFWNILNLAFVSSASSDFAGGFGFVLARKAVSGRMSRLSSIDHCNLQIKKHLHISNKKRCLVESSFFACPFTIVTMSSADAAAAGIPWVERYRPKSLKDVAHQGEVVSTLENAVKTGRLPHLLFYGPPGSGKVGFVVMMIVTYFCEMGLEC